MSYYNNNNTTTTTNNNNDVFNLSTTTTRPPSTSTKQPRPSQQSTNTTVNTNTDTATTTTTDTPELFVSFNQDAGCFAVADQQGFRIFNVEPFQEMFYRPCGGVRIVEMMFRTNIIALVGGGPSPKYPPHKVIIWDDHQNRSIGEISLKSDVLSVRLRRDRIFVSTLKLVHAYNFRDLKVMDRIETGLNPLGLMAVSSSSTRTVLACPGLERGHVRIELYDNTSARTIHAHESELAALSLNPDGSLLATASEKGTLIRVFDTSTGTLMRELRRGAESALIHCIAFNASSTFLACSSDNRTIHVFSLQPRPGDHHTSLTLGGQTNNNNNNNNNNNDPIVANTTTAASAMAKVESGIGSLLKGLLGADSFRGFPKLSLTYFQSEWSYAQFRVPEMKTLCAFGSEPNTLVVVGVLGVFYKAGFDKPGEMEKKFFARFLRDKDDDHHNVSNTGGGTSSHYNSLQQQQHSLLVSSASSSSAAVIAGGTVNNNRRNIGGGEQI
jgi:hypothetical protein